jgi:flagellar motor switch protein FliN/FliY
MSVDHERILQAFAAELADVVGTLTASAATLTTGSAPGERQWYASLALGGAGDVLNVAIDQERAATFARLVSGEAGGVEENAVAELLRTALSQAAAALGMRPERERCELHLDGLEARTASRESGFTTFAISVPGLAEPLALALGWNGGQGIAEPVGNRIDVILDIDLPVVVRFGHTELPIRALTRLGPGSVIDLGRSPDDPVEVLVSNRVVAHGEVVIVGGNYGVRILDVASQSERAQSMEA